MSVDGPPADDFPGMEHRQERITIETERHRIEGALTLARDGYRSRVSDVLNASERDFITLTDVKVSPIEGGPIALHGTNDPASIGQAASHGCVRLRNADARWLLRLAPAGTPVLIRR